ncbi:MAG TPA: nucleoside hydrolase-like domain-containing protein [Verrucomicrobiae bacterium]|nr:nucleoside hydrolase-like domain-containing protein [Verrucomicrobiae bacterium]
MKTLLIVLMLATSSLAAEPRLRLVIETDAGGDPDDEQSLVRFLLYANEWDVEGIIANRPEARNGENLNRERTGVGIARQLLNAYGQCYTNLVKNDPRYPTRDHLWKCTVPGYNGQDAAVDLIIKAVDRVDDRPLWYSDWGTDHGAATNNMLRALDRVLRERGLDEYAKFKRKLRLTSYDMYGPHTTNIAPPFGLWVNTFQPPMHGKRWYHRFSAITSKAGGFDLMRDVIQNHGPLGALYPTNTTHWQKEGDSMTFLYLVPTGMNDPDHPAWGSWAGRYGLNTNYSGRPYFWADQLDRWNGTTTRDNTVARWAADLQNDFRARMEWCIKSGRAANHPPVPKVRSVSQRIVHPGERVTLDASDSSDPDGDGLNLFWEFYPEAGTYAGPLQVQTNSPGTIAFAAPNANGVLHWVLHVTDTGIPPLTRYQRVLIKVKSGN